jgi:hypothetical protein
LLQGDYREDPESRLFHFAALIKEARVLGRPLAFFSLGKLKKYAARLRAPDASDINHSLSRPKRKKLPKELLRFGHVLSMGWNQFEDLCLE